MDSLKQQIPILKVIFVYTFLHYVESVIIKWRMAVYRLCRDQMHSLFFSTVMDKLQNDHSKHLLSLFHNNCRYLDHIVSVNNPNFS